MFEEKKIKEKIKQNKERGENGGKEEEERRGGKRERGGMEGRRLGGRTWR